MSSFWFCNPVLFVVCQLPIPIKRNHFLGTNSEIIRMLYAVFNPILDSSSILGVEIDLMGILI